MALVNKVKSQCVFNLYNNVNNKSESRITAEWSIRSTLAYTLIVAVNHFIPLSQPSIYNPKKSDLNDEALELWNLCEKSYNHILCITACLKAEEVKNKLPNRLGYGK